ncbi:MAG: lipid-A-disaccharide synthase [Saprospiraceae bacterium]
MIERIYLIAGEASADLHGSNLVNAINKLHPHIQWKGWGGQKLLSQGLDIDIRYEEANFMGFIEVIKNLPRILHFFKITKKSILEFKPDAIILIDYPGFNLRIATWAKKYNIPVYYYIAPQVWAWKESRVNIIRKCVKKLFVILPFEKEYFGKHGIQVEYYGHPLMKHIIEYRPDIDFRLQNGLSNKSIIALLPGSRIQEIKTMLPIFLQALAKECKHQIVIAGLTQHQALYNEIRSEIGLKTTVVYNCTYDLLSHSRMALVTSGTATLETALFGVPQIVCYKGNSISYFIAKRLVKVSYISLVNLILGRQVISELIQNEMNVDSIRKELNLLISPNHRRKIIDSYKELNSLLYVNNTSTQIAEEILKDFE